jgi:starch synthase
MRPMIEVLAVASEMHPFVKTGGLADVVGALPAALATHDVHVTTLLPGYPAVMAALTEAQEVVALPDFFGHQARLLRGKAGAIDLLVLDAPALYDRRGNPYLGPDGRDWLDNPLRFAALAFAAAEIGRGRVEGYRPAIVHAHDWQAALAPAYLHYGGERPRTLVTVHNLAFQGQYPPELLGALRLPPEAFSVAGVEYYGMIGFLKAGLYFADRITTVSPRYAAEIRTAEGGMGLEGLLATRAAALSGIVNGIDDAEWNPKTDPHLAQTYDGRSVDRRQKNRAALERRFGLDADETPLFAIVSRLTWQKGMDLLAEALPALVASGARLALLGSGDRDLEAAIRAVADHHQGRIGTVIGYDETLSHQMFGGADMILVPSRFEPCGLTQLYGLRYGCLPVVARVGGLSDTIVDANDAALALKAATGVQFQPVTTAMLVDAIERAVALFRDRPQWRAMQRRGMSLDLSWTSRAGAYARLFTELLRA